MLDDSALGNYKVLYYIILYFFSYIIRKNAIITYYADTIQWLDG